MRNLKYIFLLVACLTVVFGFAQEHKELDKKAKRELVVKDLNQDVHLIAEASKYQVSVGDEIQIEYRLYVSPNVGISSWELIEKPTYEGFNYKNVKFENLTIENVNYNGKSYRMVIVKKDILKSIKSGNYEVKPLQLQITAEVPDPNTIKDGFKLSMKQVTVILLSNAIKVDVKS